MKPSRIKKVFPALKVIACLSPEDSRALFPYLNHELCHGILECLENSLCNTTIPVEVRQDLVKKLKKHKSKFRYLNNKAEYIKQDPKEVKQILERKKKTLSKVSDCMAEVFDVAIPILAQGISCSKRKKQQREEQ
jgi:hypothetical protein